MFNKINSYKNNRYTIGFLIQMSTGFNGFQDLVWHSMLNAAKEYDVNAFIFTGGSVDRSPYNPFEKKLNLIYDLINKEHLDGLIINYTIGNYVASDRFLEFCRNFSIPIVTIIGSVQGFSSVRVDNKKGMRDTLLHLIRDHNLRKIAFIKGTEGNIDAEERLLVYKDTLNECGIPFDSELVYNGDFETGSGIRAVDYFIKERENNFHAIVASNDAMAFGAINRLRELGKQVPWDIAVTGFDNIDQAEPFNPSLTTVLQPFNEICSKAMKILYDNIEGKKDIESIMVPAKLIIRQSCGCSTDYVLKAKTDENVIEFKRTDQQSENKTLIKDEILQEMINVGINDIKKEELIEIIDDFIQDVQDQLKGIFLSKLEKIFQINVSEGKDVFKWQYIIYILRKCIYSLWSDEKTIFKAENMIFQACVLIGETSKQSQAYLKVIVERKSRDLREIGQQLITTFDLTQLKEVILNQLSRLDILSCFISLFDNIENEDNKSEIFIVFNNKDIEDLLIKPDNYIKHSLPNKQFLPHNRRFTYAVHPLYFRKYRLGYIMFELGPEDGIIYDTLQVQISSALMGAKLIYEREKTESMLKQRSNTIQELVRPMLDSINKVTSIAKEKISTITGLVELTKENSEKLNSTNNSIKLMNEKIIKMSNIIKIINEISAVVNMLSINTAIESAHAGQYGRGFSVIAVEIQKLADSIKNNTKEISGYLNDIRPTIEISQKAGNNSQEAFKRLEKDVFEVSQTLQLIMNSMDELSANSSQILSVMDLS